MKDKKAHRLNDVLEEVRRMREDRQFTKETRGASISPFKGTEVKMSEDFVRVASIPYREWEDVAEELALELTSLLKTPSGEQTMFPTQAMVLHDLYTYDGVIGVIRVGGGKSLPTFLAPYIKRAFRPLLLVPGNLLEKTKRHMLKDSYHWEIPNFIRVESYEKIANPDNGQLLYDYRPDLIMFDEVTKCKNPGAVVTSRLDYYFEDCKNGYYLKPNSKTQIELPGGVPPKGALSGTLTNRSLEEAWHILRWILPEDRFPLPLVRSELEQWCLACDAKVGTLQRAKPGVLLELCGPEEKEFIKRDPRKAARLAVKRRIVSTPGVVSLSKPFLGASLVVSAIEVIPPKQIQDFFVKIKRKFKTPDGQELQDAHVASMRAKEIARGLYYRPNPMPPEEYIEAKKAWGKTCRKIISNNHRRLTSEGQVIRAMRDMGWYSDKLDVLNTWEWWQNDFGKERTETVWVSDYAIDFAAKWMKKHKRGIVWVGHKGFGKRLAKKTGISYYAANSLDSKGRYIEEHPHNTPMIASIKSNLEGKNLQFGWSDNLIMYPIANGEWYEQLMGRTHRLGQPEDIVNVEIFMSCIEDYAAFWSAAEDQEFSNDVESSRKLLYADVLVPKMSELRTRDGILWTEIKMEEEAA
jgi:hypothetical protein